MFFIFIFRIIFGRTCCGTTVLDRQGDGLTTIAVGHCIEETTGSERSLYKKKKEGKERAASESPASLSSFAIATHWERGREEGRKGERRWRIARWRGGGREERGIGIMKKKKQQQQQEQAPTH